MDSNLKNILDNNILSSAGDFITQYKTVLPFAISVLISKSLIHFSITKFKSISGFNYFR